MKVLYTVLVLLAVASCAKAKEAPKVDINQIEQQMDKLYKDNETQMKPDKAGSL